MGCVISCGLKLILQVLNTVLCVAFLAVAVFGILLKSSKSIVQQLLSKIFDQFNVGNEDLRQLARFITENADGIAIVLIVVGLALATLCFIGCIASCCGCNILLKIYAAILVVILVAEIIAVALLFSDPTRLTSLLVSALEKLLQLFGDGSEEGQMSTAVWNVTMTIGSTCCGMDGYGDFEKLNKSLPLQCCNMTAISCDSKTAQSVSVPGCRDKIVKFAADNMMTFMYISIAAILLEGALIVIVMLTICL
uniref:Tetraspanin n=1 Tax=Echinococcus granulosus TaxID=6210 RepID=A0A068WQG5_ECHGR|nr:tetraspanin [Echinococcus granulosus]